MVIFKTSKYQITIPSSIEYVIYMNNSYYIDNEGRRLDHKKKNAKEYGDIYIQTINTKYTIKGVRDVSSYISKILLSIEEQKSENVIIVKLDDNNGELTIEYSEYDD